MRKILSKTILVGLTAILISGCGISKKSETGEERNWIVKEGEFRGYKARAVKDSCKKWVQLFDINDKIIFSGEMIGPDYQNFHEFYYYFEKGSPLEKYACRDSLELIYKTLPEIK